MRKTGYVRGGGSDQHLDWIGSHFEKAKANASYATGIPRRKTSDGFFNVVPEVAAQYLYYIGEKDKALALLYNYGWENGCYWEENDALVFLERGFIHKPEQVAISEDKYFRAMDIYALGNQSIHPEDFKQGKPIHYIQNADDGVYFESILALKYANEVFPELVLPILQKAISNFKRKSNTYVYMVEDSSTGDVKIGYGKNPEDRLLALQAGNPRPLNLVAKRWASVKDEELLHVLCSRFNIHREWFTEEAKDWYYYYFNLKGTTEF